MAKVTLSFKGHLLSIHHMDEHPMTIGRDADCLISIDSLAVAPRHAEIVPSEVGCLLLALDPAFPVLLNNEQVDQASLHHGDLIQIGKHTLSFSEDSQELAPQHSAPEAEPAEAIEGEDDAAPATIPAYIQVQSGPQLGRVLVLHRTVTRLNRAGAKGIAVTRKADSYRLIRLGTQEEVLIDGFPVGEESLEMELHNDSVIEVGDLRFRFFFGEDGEPVESRDAD